MASQGMMDAFEASMLQNFSRQAAHSEGATARQTDGAAYDMRSLGGFIAGEMHRSNDPEAFAGLNTASRIPTTLDQPGAKLA